MDAVIKDLQPVHVDDVDSQESYEDHQSFENLDSQIALESILENVTSTDDIIESSVCNDIVESACLDRISNISDADTSLPDTLIESQVRLSQTPNISEEPAVTARALQHEDCQQPTEPFNDVIDKKAIFYEWLRPDETQIEFVVGGQVIPCDARTLKKTKYIGEGKFGTVHEAKIENHPEVVIAVKDMRLVDKKEHEIVLRSEYESGKQVATGDCPYVIKHYGALRDKRSCSLIICLELMEIAVKACYEILHEFRQYQPNDFENFLFRLIHNICRGLHYFERKNYIHGDIKPDNMLVDAHGIFKLSDFGSCRRINETNEECNYLCGTISYFSPEILKTKKVTLQSDMWAFGISLLEIINGRELYSDLDELQCLIRVGEPTIVFPKDKVPSPILEILEKLLMKNPMDRPKSYSEILNMPCIRDLPEEPTSDEHEFISRIIRWQKEKTSTLDTNQ